MHDNYTLPSIAQKQALTPYFEAWLACFRPETQRAYRQAWSQLDQFHTDEKPLDRLILGDFAAFLRTKGMADTTIHLRLAAISSFFEFCIGEVGLSIANPASGRRLYPKINPYGKARHLSTPEVKKILSCINRASPRGARDYALILGYILTMRRNTELRQLKWGDIEQTGGQVWYRWSGKGRVDQKYELPADVWAAIEEYLVKSGRLDSIQDEDYLFSGRGKGRTPLSLSQAGRILKKYLAAAGLDRRLHVHSLRHTGAMLRKEAGEGITEISADLGHASLAVTSIYVRAIEGRRDRSSSRVMEMLQ